jgi:hypothetical protein
MRQYPEPVRWTAGSHRISPSAGLLARTTGSNSESVEVCRTPRDKNNTESPRMTENRSTEDWHSQQSRPSQTVNPRRDSDWPGCSVGLSNLKLPPLRIPPRERGRGCQSGHLPTQPVSCGREVSAYGIVAGSRWHIMRSPVPSSIMVARRWEHRSVFLGCTTGFDIRSMRHERLSAWVV